MRRSSEVEIFVRETSFVEAAGKNSRKCFYPRYRLTSPFRYIKSNAYKHTETWISLTCTSFFARLDNSWNVLIAPVRGLTATISASMTKEDIEGDLSKSDLTSN